MTGTQEDRTKILTSSQEIPSISSHRGHMKTSPSADGRLPDTEEDKRGSQNGAETGFYPRSRADYHSLFTVPAKLLRAGLLCSLSHAKADPRLSQTF